MLNLAIFFLWFLKYKYPREGWSQVPAPQCEDSAGRFLPREAERKAVFPMSGSKETSTCLIFLPVWGGMFPFSSPPRQSVITTQSPAQGRRLRDTVLGTRPAGEWRCMLAVIHSLVGKWKEQDFRNTDKHLSSHSLQNHESVYQSLRKMPIS